MIYHFYYLHYITILTEYAIVFLFFELDNTG